MTWTPVALYFGDIVCGDVPAAVAVCRQPDVQPGPPAFDLPYLFSTYGQSQQPVHVYRPSEFRIGIESHISVDPYDPTKVYVVFPGRAEGSTDSDIFVARGTIVRNPLPQLVFDPEHTLRITDAMLGDPTGTQQVMPAVAVDRYGGVNLIYVRYIPGGTPQLVDVHYARIASFDTTLGNGTGVFVKRLTPASFDPMRGPVAEFAFMGDYIGIAASGCYVYPCYPACWDNGLRPIDPADNPARKWGWYVHRVTLICTLADFNADGGVDNTDAIAYFQKFLASDGIADMNGDGAIDVTDLALYQQEWSEAVGR
jgi:hypothetical protein